MVLATSPTRTPNLRGPYSSEDSEMFIYAARLILWRKVLDALAKPAELLVGWHWWAISNRRICRPTGRSRNGTRDGFDRQMIHYV